MPHSLKKETPLDMMVVPPEAGQVIGVLDGEGADWEEVALV